MHFDRYGLGIHHGALDDVDVLTLAGLTTLIT